MCFKKPKAPKKTEADLKAEKELEEMRKIRQAQLNKEISESKERRVEAAIARAQGFAGNRSLLMGGKGGSGFAGPNTRQRKAINQIAPSAPNAGILPPGATPFPNINVGALNLGSLIGRSIGGL